MPVRAGWVDFAAVSAAFYVATAALGILEVGKLDNRGLNEFDIR